MTGWVVELEDGVYLNSGPGVTVDDRLTTLEKARVYKTESAAWGQATKARRYHRFNDARPVEVSK